MQRLIQTPRSIIPACDVSLAAFEVLLVATADLEYIGAYKIGAFLGLSVGLPRVVEKRVATHRNPSSTITKKRQRTSRTPLSGS